jgi:hypothetical protein
MGVAGVRQGFKEAGIFNALGAGEVSGGHGRTQIVGGILLCKSDFREGFFFLSGPRRQPSDNPAAEPQADNPDDQHDDIEITPRIPV